MTGARAVAGVGFVVMTIALAWGFTTGHFWEEGSVLMGMPWGVISVIDVYTGASLFSGWIAYRERSAWKTAAWVVLIFVMGNWATTLYALIAAGSSGGDARRFWMGRGASAS
jgi:hypothetical protein